MKTPDFITINNVCNILTAASTVFTAIICFITCKTYNAQFKQIRNQSLPNLQILSIVYNKSDPNFPDLSNGRHCRIYKGDSTAKISIENNIATFNTSDSSIENGFIEEIESHINCKDAYFTYFKAKPYLILNHATDINSYIIDHSNTKITLHNYGAEISAMSIKLITVKYTDKSTPDLVLHGNEKNKISLSPQQNDKLELFLDEITTDLVNSTCRVSKEVLLSMQGPFDLFKIHMPKNVLRYEKTVIILQCWNLYNEKYLLQITIEYDGNFFISSTTVLK